MGQTDVYDVGETVVLQGTFRNSAGSLVTPGSTTLYLERPDGTAATITGATIQNPSEGVVQYSDTCLARGITWWRFEGVTAGVTVIEQDYYVGRKQHAP